MLTEMIRAHIFDTTKVEVEWSANVDASQFSGTMFASQPSAEGNPTITQGSPRLMTLEFANAVDTDTSLDYAGGVPGTVNSQTIDYT